MKHILCILTAVVCWMGVPTPMLGDTSGNLKRLTLRSDLLGYEAVGKLELGNDGFCSGVLISTDLVLTAAHCLVDAAAKNDLSNLRFRAGLRDGRAIATRSVRRIVMHPKYLSSRRLVVEKINVDVGLVQLSEPIPAAMAAPFGIVRLPAAGRRVSVVSYARGREDALSRQAVCSVLGRRWGLLAFDCDVTFGASGAPVFDVQGGRPGIVSLVSSGGQTNEGRIAYGPELLVRVREVKEALRVGHGVIGGTGFTSRRIGVGHPNESGAHFVRP